jgi:hypothetical protein
MEILFILLPFLVFSLVFALALGKIGERFGVGFWKIFLISFFFSPFVGAAVIFFSKIKDLKSIMEKAIKGDPVSFEKTLIQPLSPEEKHKQKMKKYSEKNRSQ